VVSDPEIRDFTPIYTFGNTQISDMMLNYWFGRFAELCTDNDIELVCVRAPYPPSRMAISPADPVHDYFSAACSEKNLRFIDFNHIPDDTTNYYDRDFYDFHHMNMHGAGKVSADLAVQLKR